MDDGTTIFLLHCFRLRIIGMFSNMYVQLCIKLQGNSRLSLDYTYAIRKLCNFGAGARPPLCKQKVVSVCHCAKSSCSDKVRREEESGEALCYYCYCWCGTH